MNGQQLTLNPPVLDGKCQSSNVNKTLQITNARQLCIFVFMIAFQLSTFVKVHESNRRFYETKMGLTI